MSTLKIEQLEISYASEIVLKDVNLALASGEILCLLGPSGCGKTSLLKAIAGLLNIAQGSIHIDSRLVSGDGYELLPEERDVGMIFQDYALFPHLSVADNIAFGLKGKSKKYIQQQVANMLQLVKLEGLEQRYPHQISGGQQQRVAIARALAREPKLLLLDEPFSNIDAQVRHNLMKEIRSILKAQGVSAVFVTHSRDEAFVFADKIALLAEQGIAQLGSGEALYYQPKNCFVAQFMGKANFIKAELVSPHSVESSLGLLHSSKLIDKPLGTQLDLMLRPSQIQVCESQNRGVAAKVLGSLMLSDAQLTEVELAGQSLSIFGSYQGSVNLYVPEHELCLFE